MKKIVFCIALVIFASAEAKPAYYDDVNRVLFELYSQKYEAALSLADSVGKTYKNEILSDFLKAGIYSTYMSDFETDTLWDSLRKYSEKVIKSHDKKDAYEVFFAGGAYLYRTYFYVWKNDYSSTATNGMNSLKYFNKSVSMKRDLYDGYLGKGIVNYFIDKFKDKVPLLSPSGNGIREIELAADSALFTRVPAMDVLSMLYSMDGRYAEAESVSAYLRKNWPENRMFMFTHSKNLLSARKYEEAAAELELLKSNIETYQKKTYVNQAFVYYNLAETYSIINELEKARENLRKLFKLRLLTEEKKVSAFIRKGEELEKRMNK